MRSHKARNRATAFALTTLTPAGIGVAATPAASAGQVVGYYGTRADRITVQNEYTRHYRISVPCNSEHIPGEPAGWWIGYTNR